MVFAFFLLVLKLQRKQILLNFIGGRIMKSQVTLLLALLLILGACSTGTHVTGTYEDDIYFSPGDIPPQIEIAAEQMETEGEEVSNVPDEVIISRLDTNEDGSKTLNNYIFKDENQDNYLSAQLDGLEDAELLESDTTELINEDEVKYIVNNYYDDDDFDYAYRIRRFHRPGFYDPFYWDDWFYYDYYSPYAWGNWGWGLGSWYSGYYWHRPYYSWHSPYYNWGWGWPYYGGCYGGYYAYNNWYGGGYYHGSSGNYASSNRYYGKRNSVYSTVKGRSTGVTSATTGRRTALKSANVLSRTGTTDGRRNSSNGIQEARSGRISSNKSATILEKEGLLLQVQPEGEVLQQLVGHMLQPRIAKLISKKLLPARNKDHMCLVIIK